MIRRILAAFLTILLTAAGAPAWAVDCGDKAGFGGARVACKCDDNVITNTSLRAGDPVVTEMCAGVGVGLTIGADNIALNCNGREIRGEPTLDGILLVDRTGVTVRGCKITGFDRGILLVESSGNTLLSNTVSSSGSNGIELEESSSDNLVKANRVVAPVNDAINLGFGASGNMILTNTLDAAGAGFGSGIDLNGPDANDNTLKGNQISGFTTGIELESGAEGNVITQNVSSGSFNQGILVFGNANTITRNTTDGNGDNGIWVLSDGNTIDTNRGRLNGFNGLEVSGNDNIITRNTTDSNGFGDGVVVVGDGNTIDTNHGRLNGFNGLEVFGTDNIIKRNTFDDNDEWGICVSAGNTDGGMNHATGNGVVDQITFNCPDPD